MIVRCVMSLLDVRAIRRFVHALGADVRCAALVLSNGGRRVTHRVPHIAVLFAIFRDRQQSCEACVGTLVFNSALVHVICFTARADRCVVCVWWVCGICARHGTQRPVSVQSAHRTRLHLYKK
jgi:hypothetical protein